jgi:hypothetical protein
MDAGLFILLTWPIFVVVVLATSLDQGDHTPIEEVS